MTLRPPTITEVLADYGIDVDQLPMTEDRGKFICPHGCAQSFEIGRDLSIHNSARHDRSLMAAIGEQHAYEEAWRDALTELVRDRGYSLSAIGAELPTHTGRDQIQDDCEEFEIDYQSRVAGGPNSKLQHFKPEELGLSPLGEVK